jgi:hypothetical protein
VPPTIAVNRVVDRGELLEFLRPRHHIIRVTIEHWGPIAMGGFPPGLGQ